MVWPLVWLTSVNCRMTPAWLPALVRLPDRLGPIDPVRLWTVSDVMLLEKLVPFLMPSDWSPVQVATLPDTVQAVSAPLDIGRSNRQASTKAGTPARTRRLGIWSPNPVSH